MKPRVLVIDDEESIRFAFQRHLNRQGFSVETADGLKSALEAIRRFHFDVIFADIILEGRSGIDVLRIVKKRGLDCPVIMITAEPNVHTSSDAVRLGAFDYLVKPIMKDTLIRVTRHAMRHKFLIDEKKRIQKEKERYRWNLEAIFRSLKDAIITVDPEMRVIEGNEAVKNICGIDTGRMIGKRFDRLENPCRRSCRNVLEQTLKTGQTIREFRVECGHRNAPQQVTLLTCSPLTDQEDQFIGAVLVIRDITRITDLERELKERHGFHQIIGKSSEMRKIYRLIEDLSATDATALITGESGTGKELTARAIHYAGPRADRSLVTVDCNALVENLLESELFGHVRGAFTGALKNKTGRFEKAHGGTLFLDEIGDLTPVVQLKLLRVLQEKTFERVGDTSPVHVDVRIIAATNQDLREKVKRGEFREDLYYRLKVVEIRMPSLKERREDIPLLTSHFIKILNRKYKKNIHRISDETLELFMNYPWPGNIRELEHTLEHAFVVCRDRIIAHSHLPPEIREPAPSDPEFRAAEKSDTDRAEADRILEILDKTDWNKAKAARLLGISRPTLYQKIRELELARKPS